MAAGWSPAGCVRADHLEAAAGAHDLVDGAVFRMRDYRMFGGESHATRVEPITDNGVFKTECISRSSPFLLGPLRTFDDVEHAMMEWVDWFNNRRLHSRPGVSRLHRPRHRRGPAGTGT